jgi:hypothetical protein
MATCYFLDGSVASDNTPCTTGDSDTFCCADSYNCLSNGLCQSQYSGAYAIGSCTDKDWSSPSCPQFCRPITNVGNTPELSQCSISGGTFCCGSFTANPPPSCCDIAGASIMSGLTLSDASTIGFIQSNGLVQVVYTTGVSTIFTTITTSTASYTPTTPTTTATASPSSSGSVRSPNSGATTYAITGGTVGGIVVVLIFVICVVLQRRREQKRQQAINIGQYNAYNL